MRRRRRRPDGAALAERALGGSRGALARLLTLVENGHPEGQVALSRLFPRSGQAHIVGFTGATGAGKSTLVNQVACELRDRDLSLAVVAVDPSSPFSGGAVLGDRLRMRDLAEDPAIFIRSMASRGHPGGVAQATRDVVTVLDALGTPVILVETVGAGQAQVEVAQIAHTVVLVEAPGMGDDVQALKAGLLEIADIIVINKADRPEAKQTLRAIRSAHLEGLRFGDAGGPADLGEETQKDRWTVPVLETSALEGRGIVELVDAMGAHREALKAQGIWRGLRERHARAQLAAWLQQHLQALIDTHLAAEDLEMAVQSIVRRDADPASAAQALVDRLVETLIARDSG